MLSQPSACEPVKASVAIVPDKEPVVYTVEEFCEAHRISRTTFFRLRRESSGPKVKEIGGKLVISREAARAWRNGE